MTDERTAACPSRRYPYPDNRSETYKWRPTLQELDNLRRQMQDAKEHLHRWATMQARKGTASR